MDIINWPITTGCENLGGGCESCPSLWEYREKGWDYSVVFHEEQLDLPLKTKEPTAFTVSLGSDLFHDRVPDWFIERAFLIMNQTPHHVYEIGAKRTERMKDLAPRLKWTDNIAIGVTVESAEYKDRIDHLREVPAKTRFISFLPLLGEVGVIDLAGIHRVAVGPEEWGLFRPCEDAWVNDIQDQCHQQGVELLDYYNIYDYKEA